MTALIDFGPQPLCNRFLPSSRGEEYTHLLKLGFCRRCGVIEQMVPAPNDQIRPRYDWITYSEPEGHLDELVGELTQLADLGPDSMICGITFKDDSTLARFRNKGFSRTRRLDLKEDLEITDPGAGLETIQDRLTVERARKWAQRWGKCHLLVVRHILEHAHDLPHFMDALRELVSPKGYVVFEIPDCARALEKFDFSSIWEEHVFYFTEPTYKRALAHQGFFVEQFKVIPYSLENSLVAIGQFHDRKSVTSDDVLPYEMEQAMAFAGGFEIKKTEWRKFLAEARRQTRPIAMFGAGHSSCAFINLLGLSDLIDFFVDDNPHKKGLLMPGSRLPISPSSSLIEKAVKFCLLSVSPENEPKVMEKNQSYLKAGGRFVSIFPDSPYSFQRTKTHANTAI
ncbi:MAG: methyltransferase domain-containing protein [Elusimicrobia bacterium]|nr:methyltransferase domain-containing protein [Elusimicrobiota bacterium]